MRSCDTLSMRNLTTGWLSLTLLSLLLTSVVAGQATRQTIAQVPKRAAVSAPRLNVVQLSGPEVVVVDLTGNGIDLSGSVRTSLVTGSATAMRWVKPQSDDAIVVVNATALRSGGWSLMTAAGEPLDGFVFPRAGLTVVDASGGSSTAATGLDLLARLDANHDGRIDKADPAWAATTLFRDRNADGAIGAGELTRAGEVLRSIDVTVPGTARLLDGTAVAIAHVKLATIK